MNLKFKHIKDEILRRARVAHACTKQYGRAYKAETMQDLCNVIKDNFDWAYRNMVIDTALLMLYRDDFAKNGIFVNTSVSKGYLLCGNATVEACGNATVRAYGNATVEACGNATVRAYGNATVEACGNATVEACGNATVEACGNATVRAYGNAYCQSYSLIECKLSENAIYRVRSTQTVFYASDNITFKKH